jgi:small-conductance mechanosensitive channel
MNRTATSPLLELIEDLQDPRVIWQIGAIIVALLLAWLINTWLCRRVRDQGALQRFLFAVGTPLFAWLLLTLMRGPLAAQLNFLGSARLMAGAGMLILTFAAIRFTIYAMRRAFTKETAWLGGSERAITISLWLLFVLIFTGMAADVWKWAESVQFSLGKIKLNLAESLAGIVSVLVTLLAALWAGSAVEARLMQAQRLNLGTKVVLARVVKALLLVIGVLTAFSVVGIDLTVLSVFGGALGVGLGLGLQRIASNYVSGFIILLDRSIQIGDMISVDKYYGRVMQINTRYTVLRALDQSKAIIPNEMLMAQPVLNNSYADTNTRGTVKLNVSYGTSLNDALQLLKQQAILHPRVVREPAPIAQANAFGVEGIELELAFWVLDPENGTNDVRSDLILAIYEAFNTQGIRIPRVGHAEFVDKPPTQLQ